MKRDRILHRGRSLLSVVVAIPAAMLIAGVGWFTYTEYRRNHWDDKVRELCAKDGGIVVYQQIPLPVGEPIPSIRDERFADRDALYVSRWKEEILHERAPEVVRREAAILKRPENIILGRQIFYRRIGGDFGFSDNPSSFGCQNIKAESVERNILVSQGAAK